jgi:DNA-binding HxlR family transcriptional regulator
MEWVDKLGMTSVRGDEREAPDGRAARASGPRGGFESRAWVQCTQEVLVLLGRKWGLAIIHGLAAGPRRHSQLLHGLSGITAKVLTETLRFLERDGVVARVLVREEFDNAGLAYELTALGCTLAGPLDGLYSWGVEHLDEVRRAQQRTDDRRGRKAL